MAYTTSRPRSTSATTTLVPAAMVASGSSGMASHSSPRALIRPGWCSPLMALVTRAVSPIIPCTPLSTDSTLLAADENGLPLLGEGRDRLRRVLRREVQRLTTGLVLHRLLHGGHGRGVQQGLGHRQRQRWAGG